MDVNEQATGADKKYDVGTAIYIQFKKSDGLKSVGDIAPSTRSNRSRLEEIREFRNRRGLAQDPTLYFQLRRKAPNAADFQHNVLLAYENPPWSRAVYVAPLFLDRTAYDNALFGSAGRFLTDPFYYHLPHQIHSKYLTQYYLEFSPFLRGHVSIAPHQRVDTHEHFYAYSENGCDISWHSPEVREEGPSRLSDFLGEIVEGAIRDPELMRPLPDLARTLTSRSLDLGLAVETSIREEAPLAALTRLGSSLSSSYQIRQFLLLANAEHLERNRSGR